jgi:hypothetical protein
MNLHKKCIGGPMTEDLDGLVWGSIQVEGHGTAHIEGMVQDVIWGDVKLCQAKWGKSIHLECGGNVVCCDDPTIWSNLKLGSGFLQ